MLRASYLLEKPFSLRQLSYASHSYRFPSYFETYPPDRLEMVISDAFLQLLDLTISTIRHHRDYPIGSPSYNVIITLEHMHIIPRRRDGYIMLETGEKLGVNALGFAGMLLAKTEQEVEAVKRESIGQILRGVGLPSVHDIPVE
jgi:ATP adenylyltransferase